MKKIDINKVLLTAFAFLSGMTLSAQGVCTQFSYFYADINYPASGAQTDFYSVSLEDGNAVLTPILSDVPGQHHLAFDEASQLLYVVRTSNGSIRTLDPLTGDLSSPTSVVPNISSVPTTAFNSEGELLIGSNSGTIYSVDLGTNPYELDVYSENNDILGGDITFAGEGSSESLYLASKPLGKFYEVIPGFNNNMFDGNVDGEVTGMATFENGTDFIVSSRNNDQFLVYSLDGDEIFEVDAYNAILNGEPFSLENGDMASGCSERSTSIEGCEDFRTYYMEDAQGGGMDNLYEVSFNGMGGVILNNKGQFASSSHMGVGADGLLYIVEYSTGLMTVFDPSLEIIEYTVQITYEGNNLTAIPAVVVGDDGFVYVGSDPANMVYKVHPSSGIADEYGAGNVAGGDLVFVGDQLWVANRGLGRFFEINGPGEFDVTAEEINGVSILPDGNLLIANGNLNGLFEVYEPGTGAATGETFETGLALFNGDLASRCFDGQPEFQDCDDFKTYYIDTPQGGGDVVLYELQLTDLGVANVTPVKTLDGDSHLGLGPNGLLYVVRANSGLLTILDPEDINDPNPIQIQITNGGNNITNIPAVVAGDDGLLYIGSGNTIYSLDPFIGEAAAIGNQNISGGDLVFINGALWYANRSNATFYEVNGPGEFPVGAAEINGVSVLPSGDLLIADGDLGNTFEVYEPFTGNPGVEFETDLELFWGDLASRCFDDNNQEDECDNYQLFLAANGNQGGDIYRVAIEEGMISLDPIAQLQDLGRPHIAYDESNGRMYIILGPTGEVAIYDPVQDILTAFTNISMGSMNITETFSATVKNDGTLLVGSNSDGAVYEVNPVTGAASNPVSAEVDGGDIIQTNDDDVWVINRGQGRFYNITDGTSEFDVDLNGIYGAAVMESGMILTGYAGNELRVVDPTIPGLTETVYELNFSISAGDLAGGCGDNYEPMEEQYGQQTEMVAANYSIIEAYPNPTENFSTIRIVAAESERAVLEIFDMNGRSVVTLLNRDVQKGNTYTTQFDGSVLPNGIYIVKYVTSSETTIEKIMIAR